MHNYSDVDFTLYGYSFVLGCLTVVSCFLLALVSLKANSHNGYKILPERKNEARKS